MNNFLYLVQSKIVGMKCMSEKILSEKNHTKTSSVRIDKSCTKELVNVFPGKKIPNVHR